MCGKTGNPDDAQSRIGSRIRSATASENLPPDEVNRLVALRHRGHQRSAGGTAAATRHGRGDTTSLTAPGERHYSVPPHINRTLHQWPRHCDERVAEVVDESPRSSCATNKKLTLAAVARGSYDAGASPVASLRDRKRPTWIRRRSSPRWRCPERPVRPRFRAVHVRDRAHHPPTPDFERGIGHQARKRELVRQLGNNESGARGAGTRPTRQAEMVAASSSRQRNRLPGPAKDTSITLDRD